MSGGSVGVYTPFGFYPIIRQDRSKTSEFRGAARSLAPGYACPIAAQFAGTPADYEEGSYVGRNCGNHCRSGIHSRLHLLQNDWGPSSSQAMVMSVPPADFRKFTTCRRSFAATTNRSVDQRIRQWGSIPTPTRPILPPPRQARHLGFQPINDSADDEKRDEARRGED